MNEFLWLRDWNQNVFRQQNSFTIEMSFQLFCTFCKQIVSHFIINMEFISDQMIENQIQRSMSLCEASNEQRDGFRCHDMHVVYRVVWHVMVVMMRIKIWIKFIEIFRLIYQKMGRNPPTDRLLVQLINKYPKNLFVIKNLWLYSQIQGLTTGCIVNKPKATSLLMNWS